MALAPAAAAARAPVTVTGSVRATAIATDTGPHNAATIRAGKVMFSSLNTFATFHDKSVSDIPLSANLLQHIYSCTHFFISCLFVTSVIAVYLSPQSLPFIRHLSHCRLFVTSVIAVYLSPQSLQFESILISYTARVENGVDADINVMSDLFRETAETSPCRHGRCRIAAACFGGVGRRR